MLERPTGERLARPGSHRWFKIPTGGCACPHRWRRDYSPVVFCHADALPPFPGTGSITPRRFRDRNTSFMEFSDRIPHNSLAIRFVIPGCESKYLMTVSCGDASGSCLMLTSTEFSFSSISGSLSLSFFIASNAALSPSPTSLLGGSGNLCNCSPPRNLSPPNHRRAEPG